MNRFMKKTLWLFCMVSLFGMFFSCKEDGYYYPRWEEERAICNVPKFYDDKQGSYKGKVFLIKSDSVLESVPESVEIKFGNYANKSFAIQRFPLRYLLERMEDNSELPSYILERRIKISFEYLLYGYLTNQVWPSYERLDGDSIDPGFRKSLYIGLKKEIFCDSVYNEDMTQKLKYEVHGYDETDSNSVILELRHLEFNNRRLAVNYDVPIVKIKIDKNKIKE